MLVFATSDKGGTGRSVTGCNLAYRRALLGSDVCYLDFDFGSPTAGAIFELSAVATGTERGGLHAALQGRVGEPMRVNVWLESDLEATRTRPVTAGELVLLPGDRGGGEFPMNGDVVDRCTELFLRMEEEFDVCFVDLSAGRSHAIDAVLEATCRPELRTTIVRWLVFHRWTRQHIVAAADLVYGERGVLKTGISYGHDEMDLRDAIRFVRTAVLDPNAPEQMRMRDAQKEWLRRCDASLRELAHRQLIGASVLLGQTPLDPLLQWREQLISDADVKAKRIANPETLAAFDALARKLVDDSAWEGL
jgi:hypothetical protein